MTALLRVDLSVKISGKKLEYSLFFESNYACDTQEQIAKRKCEKEKRVMSSKNSNKLNVPEARAAMDKFKMEAAAEVGVDLKEGYNGHLTSREAGSVGGQMVKKMSTVRTANYTRKDRTAIGHEIEVRYIAAITV